LYYSPRLTRIHELVIKAREQIQSRATTSESPAPVDTSLFTERAQAAAVSQPPAAKKPVPKAAIAPAEAQRLNRERTDAVIRGFKRLKEIDPGDIVLGPDEGLEGWDEWMSLAEELASWFMEEKKLFIADRVSTGICVSSDKTVIRHFSTRSSRD
jgi:hypothetical protein